MECLTEPTPKLYIKLLFIVKSQLEFFDADARAVVPVNKL